MTSERLVFIGGGAMAMEYCEWARNSVSGMPVFGYLDDSGETALSSTPYDLEYLGTVASYTLNEKDRFVFAFSKPDTKRAAHLKLVKKGSKFGSIIHKTAFVSRSCVLGEGVVLSPYSVVSVGAKVGNHVAVNLHSTIGHGVVIGEYSTLASHVDLTGNVSVGSGVFFGSGSRVIPGVDIGENSVIGAGAVVIGRVKPSSTVFSVPSMTL